MKVYNNFDTYNSLTKINKYSGTEIIWNINEAIEILWNRYNKSIEIRDFNGLSDLENISKEYDIVFNTIPLSQFDYSCVHSTSYVLVFDTILIQNKVFYDISPNSSIYRTGSLFGQFFIESTTPLLSSIPVKKVASTEHRVKFPENVYLMGRYGAWNKSILAHDVYYEVLGILQ